MNEWLCEPLAWDDSAPLRPRQGADRRGARGGPGVRPLSRRRRRRHPLPHLSRHAPDPRRLLHPRHLARPLCALHRGGARSTSTTCSGCCASSRPRRRSCRSRCGATPKSRPAAASSTSARPRRRCDEALDALEAQGVASRYAARARASPSRDEVIDFIARPRPGVRGRAEPRRAVAHPARQRGRDRPGAADPGPALRRHADHRALHRRRDRASCWPALAGATRREAAE